jgi:plastocyanin
LAEPCVSTATAIEGGGEDRIVQVLSGAPRFELEDIVVVVGATVTWVWGTNSAGHNVVPDNGTTPAASGPWPVHHTPTPTPSTMWARITITARPTATSGGVGMSGTVQVVRPAPPP